MEHSRATEVLTHAKGAGERTKAARGLPRAGARGRANGGGQKAPRYTLAGRGRPDDDNLTHWASKTRYG